MGRYHIISKENLDTGQIRQKFGQEWQLETSKPLSDPRWDHRLAYTYRNSGENYGSRVFIEKRDSLNLLDLQGLYDSQKQKTRCRTHIEIRGGFTDRDVIEDDSERAYFLDGVCRKVLTTIPQDIVIFKMIGRRTVDEQEGVARYVEVDRNLEPKLKAEKPAMEE